MLFDVSRNPSETFPTFNNQRENIGFATVDFGTAFQLLDPVPGVNGHQKPLHSGHLARFRLGSFLRLQVGVAFGDVVAVAGVDVGSS